MKKRNLLISILALTNIIFFFTKAEETLDYYYDNDLSGYQISAGKEMDEISDPFEVFNRSIFSFNEMLDFLVFDRISNVYLVVFPQPIQNNISSFYVNLTNPVTAVNQIFQGDFSGSIVSIMRFVTNITLGLGGIVDIASEFDMPNATEDFGKTLGLYGVPDGPYLVLPILGPSNTRDLVGKTFDYYIDPTSKLVKSKKYLVLSGGKLIYLKAYNYNLLDNLRSNSIDYYTTIKSLYTQNRRNHIYVKLQK